MDKNEIKEILLKTQIFDNNLYLDKYCTLIVNNVKTERKLYCTQKHHILPKFYFKYINQPIDDSSTNTVNLIYKNHILAHYYLERCINNPELRGKNFFAIYKLCGSARISREELYVILNDEKLLNEFIHYKSANTLFSEEHRRKLSEKDKKMIYIHKDGKQTKILPEQLESYLNDGWIRGGKPGRLSAEHKAKLAASHKNISDSFRKEQSIRLKNFYKNNPDWKTKSKKAVKVTNPKTGEFQIFDSCLAAAKALELPEYCAKAGYFKSWINQGYIGYRKSNYYHWLIVYINN